MIDSRAELTGRSEADAGCRLRGDATVRWRFKYASSTGTSLSSIIEPASSSAFEWDECRRDSTRVLSSAAVSASNVGSRSKVELVLVPVGEGKAARVPNESWWWWRRREATSVFLFPNTAAVFTEKIWASWVRRGGEGTRIAWQRVGGDGGKFGMELWKKIKRKRRHRTVAGRSLIIYRAEGHGVWVVGPRKVLVAVAREI